MRLKIPVHETKRFSMNMTAPQHLRSSPRKTVVAIIGGGASGAMVAYHLASSDQTAVSQIVVFEPREAIGKGLAYDTADPVHRINVPATRMSMLPDEPEHFARWITETGVLVHDPEAIRPDGSVFPRRSVFGDYVQSYVQPLMKTGIIRHVRSSVIGVEKAQGRWHITDSAGDVAAADILVIATTHPAPTPPALLKQKLAGHPRFIADPTALDALLPVRQDDRVLVVGNGLTSADVIASLKQRGHRGTIVSLSRRGLRSRGHAQFPQEPFGDFRPRYGREASELLSSIRTTIRIAKGQGLTWHSVLDQVRAEGSALWCTLSLATQQRLVRHLRVYWDVHRFRIAPQVEDVLESEAALGKLEILAASIDQVDTKDETISVVIRRRGTRRPETHDFDAVVVTTGPAHGRILSSQAWLRNLSEAGRLDIDPTGLGLACNEHSQALGADGSVDPSLFIAGPLARGRFGELMGFPQVSEHAVLVAGLVARASAYGIDLAD